MKYHDLRDFIQYLESLDELKRVAVPRMGMLGDAEQVEFLQKMLDKKALLADA